MQRLDTILNMETIEYKGTKTFSGRRFMTLLKSDFKINGSHYLKLAFAAVGCFVAISVLLSIGALSDINNLIINNPQLLDSSITEQLIDGKRTSFGITIIVCCLIIGNILFTVFGSLTFSNLANKRERITAFMVPSSLCEKFALRALVYFGFGLITIIVGMLIAALIAQLSFGAYSNLTWIQTFFDEGYSWQVVWILTLVTLIGNAIYTLGSSLWPRLSWIKTWIVLNIVQWGFGIMLISGLFSSQDWIYTLLRYLENNDSLTYVFITFEGLLIALCWIGAWFRYRSTQIVQLFMKK